MLFMKMPCRNEKQKGLEKWGLNKGLLVKVPGLMHEEDELQRSKVTEPRSQVSSWWSPGSPHSAPPMLALPLRIVFYGGKSPV